MPNSIDQAPGLRLGTKVAVASIALATAASVLYAINASADASQPRSPAVTVGTIGPIATVGPTIGPIATAPPFTFVTFVTLPPPTTVPATSTTNPSTTSTATSTTAATSTTTLATETTETTETTTGDAAASAVAVEITAAQVNCDGMIHVEFDTTALPEPETSANHLIVFNPTSNPAAFAVVETVGNPPNGTYTFEQPGSINDSYRIFVIALFDPADVDGPKAIDQADVLLDPAC